ncbi:hypothetical protein DFH09DRAFT_1308433 [Mycena vulgaris]|nr:hypothetical protein DFH09DRAFT_1308433 [Mycena vulgaris]
MANYLVEDQVTPAASAACRTNAFMLWQCIPLGLNRVLPYALGVTLITASQVLRRRALAIHGAALVPMPQPVPRPLYSDKIVPAWMTLHMAELELPVSVEEGVESEKGDIQSAPPA